MSEPFPFTAIVGQDDMKLALILAAIDPSIGGVLAFGDRGAGKSTAVRALAALLPEIRVVVGCPYACAPKATAGLCEACQGKREPKAEMRAPRVVDLPLGATEDRVVGALDLERALASGERRFEPGLLAQANRGFLYIDEVNLLEDHLVDLLLDVAASGVNVVEREGLSLRHPAKLVLIGSGNPEEGELRPQLLDRFGLSVEVRTPADIPTRIEVVRRRDRFDRDPAGFVAEFADAQKSLRTQIARAREIATQIETPEAALERAAQLCVSVGADGLRGELTLIRAARALAAFEGARTFGDAQLKRLAPMTLSHRLRRNPLDEAGSGARVARALAQVFS